MYETEGFKTFFRQMTPLLEIAELKIGSRPASRTKSDRIEDLRAIPWVFSWAQARVMLPGWYGVGHGVARVSRPGPAARDGRWPGHSSKPRSTTWKWCSRSRTWRSRSATPRWCRTSRCATRIFDRIRAGWIETHDCLLSITGQSKLLEKNPVLDASIRLRLPYIEPLNLLQVELLKRHRAGETDARVREGIQLSINAVATALRNSG